MHTDPSNIATLGEIKANYLGIDVTTDDNFINNLRDALFKSVEVHCNRIFTKQQFTEYYSGDGNTGVLFVKNPPVDAISSLHDDPDRDFDSDTLFPTGDYTFDDESGVVELLDSIETNVNKTIQPVFSKGVRNIKIVYTGGFGTIPFPVKHAALVWLTYHYKQKDRMQHGLSSREGTESERYISMKMPVEVQEILAPWIINEIG